MRKAFFLAIGITAMFYGLEFLGAEKLMLKTHSAAPQKTSIFDVEDKILPGREFVPPSWSPWSLLAGGAVTCLYCFTIPRRLGG